MDPRRAIAQLVLERHRARVLSLVGLAGLSVGACTTGKAEPGSGLLVAPMQPVPGASAEGQLTDAGADGSQLYRPFPREPTEPRGGSCTRTVDCTAETDEKPEWPYAPPFTMCAVEGDHAAVFNERETRKARGSEPGTCCYVWFKCDEVVSGRPKRPSGVIVRGRRLEGGPAIRARGLGAMLEAEHFSVFAFRALARDLALHGAPAELIAAAFDAAEDEASHVVATRRLMELDGLEAHLDERGASLPSPATFAALVRAAFVDGCMGEGAVALQFEVAATHRAGTEQGALLAAVAADEARHADLGFRTLRWALESRPEEAADALRAAVEEVTEAGLPADEAFLPASEASQLAAAWLAVVVAIGAALAA